MVQKFQSPYEQLDVHSDWHILCSRQIYARMITKAENKASILHQIKKPYSIDILKHSLSIVRRINQPSIIY